MKKLDKPWVVNRIHLKPKKVGRAGAIRAAEARHHFGKRMVTWRLALERKWKALRFDEVKVETDKTHLAFEVHLHLDGLDPDAVRVELYAEGVGGGAPVRIEMEPARQPADTAGCTVYRVSVTGHAPRRTTRFGWCRTRTAWRFP